MGWGEEHGPSQAMVARRFRSEAADRLADCAGLLLAGPTPEGLTLLREALNIYRHAQAEDAT